MQNHSNLKFEGQILIKLQKIITILTELKIELHDLFPTTVFLVCVKIHVIQFATVFQVTYIPVLCETDLYSSIVQSAPLSSSKIFSSPKLKLCPLSNNSPFLIHPNRDNLSLLSLYLSLLNYFTKTGVYNICTLFLAYLNVQHVSVQCSSILPLL